MTIVAIILVIFCCILAYMLAISLMKNVEMFDRLEEVEERFIECTEAVTRSHEKLESKLKLEVFYDDPVVKELVNDMKETREVLEEVAQTLGQMTREDADEDGDEKEADES